MILISRTVGYPGTHPHWLNGTKITPQPRPVSPTVPTAIWGCPAQYVYRRRNNVHPQWPTHLQIQSMAIERWSQLSSTRASHRVARRWQEGVFHPRALPGRPQGSNALTEKQGQGVGCCKNRQRRQRILHHRRQGRDLTTHSQSAAHHEFSTLRTSLPPPRRKRARAHDALDARSRRRHGKPERAVTVLRSTAHRAQRFHSRWRQAMQYSPEGQKRDKEAQERRYIRGPRPISLLPRPRARRGPIGRGEHDLQGTPTL